MTHADGQTRRALTRREFLTAMFPAPKKDTPAPPEESHVPGRFSLSGLKHLPAPVLGRMVPVLRQGWTADIQDDHVAYRGDAERKGVVPLPPEGCAAVRMFDGIRTLEQIAAALEIERGQPPGSLFPQVRHAFLALSAREVYHPDGPPRNP